MADGAEILGKILQAAERLAETPETRRLRETLLRDRQAIALGPRVLLVFSDFSPTLPERTRDRLSEAGLVPDILDAGGLSAGEAQLREALALLEWASCLLLVLPHHEAPSPLAGELLRRGELSGIERLVFQVGSAATPPLLLGLSAQPGPENLSVLPLSDPASLAREIEGVLLSRREALFARHRAISAGIPARRRETLTRLVQQQKEQHDDLELFWQQQEARRSGRIGQPGCLTSGLLTLALETAGDFAVMLYGDRDCATANKANPYAPPPAGKLYIAAVDADTLAAGRASDRLRRGLAALARERRPAFILLLSTCPVIVSHDPFEEIAREVEAETGVPIEAIRSHGLGSFTQARALDLFARRLLSASERAGMAGEPQPERIACLGFPGELFVPGGEVTELLERAGFAPPRVAGPGSTLAQWLSLTEASCLLTPDRSLFPSTCALLERRGMTIIETELPIGISQSLAFYQALREQALPRAPHAARRLDTEIARLSDTARHAVAQRREALEGLRVGYGLGMFVDFNPRTLAGEGLAEARALCDYGVTVEFLVQGAANDQHLEQAAAHTRARGFDAPCHAIRDIATLEGLAAGRGLGLVVAAEHMGMALERAGVPGLRLGFMAPGLGATDANLRRLLNALQGKGGRR